MISIINGAQTLSTSAEFFYEEESTPEIKNAKDRAKEKAKVLLKIIHMKNMQVPENQETCYREIDKISLALNRQKPIQPEDIAFTTKFINKLNEIKDMNSDNEFVFTIIRRGDYAKNGYTLVDFARAAKAYLEQCPGKARSGAKKEFLDIETDNESYGFKDKNIFKKELIDEDKDPVKTFNKYYKPVNFAMKLQEYYAKRSSTIKKQLSDPKHVAILNYGKWHFVAYVILVLNNFNYLDFTNFNVTIKGIDTNYLDISIKEFISLFSQCAAEGFDKIDSNQFKNEDLYNKFISYKDKSPNTQLVKEIKQFNELIKMRFSNEYPYQEGGKEIAASLLTEK